MEYKIVKIIEQEKIAEIMREFNSDFPRALDSMVTLVATLEKNVLGYIIFYINDYKSRRGYISQLAVKQNFRGLGIGKMLLKECIAYALDKEFIKICLEVDKENTNAIQFYKRMNFNISDEATEVSWYMEKTIFSNRI